MTKKEQGWLTQLQRRILWLQNRIENYNGKNPSYDIHELHALQWAVQVIKQQYPEVP